MSHYDLDAGDHQQNGRSFLDGLDAFLDHVHTRIKLLKSRLKGDSAAAAVKDLETLAISVNSLRSVYLGLTAKMAGELGTAIRQLDRPELLHLAGIVERGEVPPFLHVEKGA